MELQLDPLQESPTDNTALSSNGKMRQTIDRIGTPSLSASYQSMNKIHNEFFDSIGRLDKDTTLPQDGKILLAGRMGNKARDNFGKSADNALNELAGMERTLEKKLYTSSIKVDSNQMALVGLIGDEIKSKGLEYLDGTEYAHPVAAILAQANLFDETTNNAIIKKLNNMHSAEVLDDIESVKTLRRGIDAAIQREKQLVTKHTPTHSKLKELEESSVLDHLKRIAGSL